MIIVILNSIIKVKQLIHTIIPLRIKKTNFWLINCIITYLWLTNKFVNQIYGKMIHKRFCDSLLINKKLVNQNQWKMIDKIWARIFTKNIWKSNRTLKEKGHLKSNIQMAFLIDSIISSKNQLRSQLFEISHPFPL